MAASLSCAVNVTPSLCIQTHKDSEPFPPSGYGSGHLSAAALRLASMQLLAARTDRFCSNRATQAQRIGLILLKLGKEASSLLVGVQNQQLQSDSSQSLDPLQSLQDPFISLIPAPRFIKNACTRASCRSRYGRRCQELFG